MVPINTFIVADLHGCWELAEGLLGKAGVLDAAGERDYDVWSIQLGDLIHSGHSEESIVEDRKMLRRAFDEQWFDTVLVGNHEHPYFGGPAFHGFIWDGAIEAGLKRLRLQPATSFTTDAFDVLITHAGLVRSFEDEPGYETPNAACLTLRRLWRADPRHRVFSAISSRRGGFGREGGILWADWEEPKLRTFNQIVGHTPGDKVREVLRSTLNGGQNWTINIDCEAKFRGQATGLWITDEGERSVITYSGE